MGVRLCGHGTRGRPLERRLPGGVCRVGGILAGERVRRRGRVVWSHRLVLVGNLSPRRWGGYTCAGYRLPRTRRSLGDAHRTFRPRPATGRREPRGPGTRTHAAAPTDG